MPIEQFMTVAEVASRLGFSTKWVYQRVNEGAFAGAFKHRGDVRIPAGAVQRWIANNNELVQVRVIGGRSRKLANARKKLAELQG